MPSDARYRLTAAVARGCKEMVQGRIDGQASPNSTRTLSITVTYHHTLCIPPQNLYNVLYFIVRVDALNIYLTCSS